MSDPRDDSQHNPFRKCPPLPEWIARRLLWPGEQVTWIRGPRASPGWERYVTHPALFLIALAISAILLAENRLIAGTWEGTSPVLVVMSVVLILGSIFILALTSGYFTRLIVTNQRIVLMQGREVIRQWSMDDLPRSLLRYRRQEGVQETRAVDLEALETMLGGMSDQFADPKTLRSFAKQIDRIKTREDGPPSGPAQS